jgi:hypothetical protein
MNRITLPPPAAAAGASRIEPRRRAGLFRQWRNRAYNAWQDFLDYYFVGISILKRKLGFREKNTKAEDLWRELDI